MTAKDKAQKLTQKLIAAAALATLLAGCYIGKAEFKMRLSA